MRGGNKWSRNRRTGSHRNNPILLTAHQDDRIIKGMADNPDDTEKEGGIGGSLFDRPVNIRSDIRLIRRAIKNGWGVSRKVKKQVVAKMVEVMETAEEDRSKIGAAKVLIQADAIDQRTEIAAMEPSRPLPPIEDLLQEAEERYGKEYADAVRASLGANVSGGGTAGGS